MAYNRYYRKEPEEQYKINEKITAKVVNVVHDGEMLGEMPTEKAIGIAQEHELDLVEVAPNQSPPVCKIMSYAKFKYEEKKKLKKAKLKGKTKDRKEMRFAPQIGPGDLAHKLKRVKEFLGDGHSVKITIRFKWRQTPEQGQILVDKILTDLEGTCSIEQELKKQGRFWNMVVKPEKNTKSKVKEEDKDAKAKN